MRIHISDKKTKYLNVILIRKITHRRLHELLLPWCIVHRPMAQITHQIITDAYVITQIL